MLFLPTLISHSELNKLDRIDNERFEVDDYFSGFQKGSLLLERYGPNDLDGQYFVRCFEERQLGQPLEMCGLSLMILPTVFKIRISHALHIYNTPIIINSYFINAKYCKMVWSFLEYTMHKDYSASIKIILFVCKFLFLLYYVAFFECLTLKGHDEQVYGKDTIPFALVQHSRQ